MNDIDLITINITDKMEILQVTIPRELEKKLIDHLTMSIKFDYMNIQPVMSILAAEEYFFRTQSYQMNMIVIKAMDTFLQIDLVGGAGGTGLLGIDWGSEKAFLKRTRHLLRDFCNLHGAVLGIVQ